MTVRQPLADIQFIADFAAFCRTKGDEAYDYYSCGNCACAQFLRNTNRSQRPDVGGFGWTDEQGRHDFPEGVPDAIPGSRRTVPELWTFNQLADRLEALIADAPAIAKATGAS